MGFLIFLAALILLTLAFSFYCYLICFHASRKLEASLDTPLKGEQYEAVADRMIASAKRMADAPFEPVTITDHKGKKLYGRYYELQPGAPLMMIFHGYRGVAFRDCAGGFAMAKKLGFNVLAVDQRSHGESDGRVITFGVHERHDCLLWANYAASRFGENTPILLSGVSMGAATVLMASDLPLPKNVVGIMADCPYSSPMDIILKVGRDIGYPAPLVRPLVWLAGIIYGGFNVSESSAVKSVQKAKLPILLVHGEDDRFVPCDMSREIYKKCVSKAQLHTFPDAGHGLCYLIDAPRYERLCIDFMQTIEPLREFLSHSEYVKQLYSA